jgi:hypothetical protein
VLLLHTGELRDRERHLWFGPRLEIVREADGGQRIQDLRASTIKNLAFAGFDLIVTFGTDSPRTDIELRFGSDWQVAAAQTKDATSAGRYLWNWLRFAE